MDVSTAADACMLVQRVANAFEIIESDYRSHCLARPVELSRATGRTVSGDRSHCLGRPVALSRATGRIVSRDRSN